MRESGGALVWVLAFIGAAGLGFGVLIGVGCAIGANACPFSDRAATATTDGRAIWLAECAACHGAAGEGGRGPSLRTPRAGLDAEAVRHRIERGSVGLMPRYKGKLSPAQIDAIARYAFALREAA